MDDAAGALDEHDDYDDDDDEDEDEAALQQRHGHGLRRRRDHGLAVPAAKAHADPLAPFSAVAVAPAAVTTNIEVNGKSTGECDSQPRPKKSVALSLESDSSDADVAFEATVREGQDDQAGFSNQGLIGCKNPGRVALKNRMVKRTFYKVDALRRFIEYAEKRQNADLAALGEAAVRDPRGFNPTDAMANVHATKMHKQADSDEEQVPQQLDILKAFGAMVGYVDSRRTPGVYERRTLPLALVDRMLLPKGDAMHVSVDDMMSTLGSEFNPFSRQFVFLPFQDESHFSMAIICNAAMALPSRSQAETEVRRTRQSAADLAKSRDPDYIEQEVQLSQASGGQSQKQSGKEDDDAEVVSQDHSSSKKKKKNRLKRRSAGQTNSLAYVQMIAAKLARSRSQVKSFFESLPAQEAPFDHERAIAKGKPSTLVACCSNIIAEVNYAAVSLSSDASPRVTEALKLLSDLLAHVEAMRLTEIESETMLSAHCTAALLGAATDWQLQEDGVDMTNTQAQAQAAGMAAARPVVAARVGRGRSLDAKQAASADEVEEVSPKSPAAGVTRLALPA